MIIGKTGNVISVDFSNRARRDAQPAAKPGLSFSPIQLSGLTHLFLQGKNEGVFARAENSSTEYAACFKFFAHENAALPVLTVTMTKSGKSPYYTAHVGNFHTRQEIASSLNFGPVIAAARSHISGLRRDEAPDTPFIP